MKKSKVIHLTLVLFMIFSSFLMTVGTVVIDKTSKSMNQLFAIAKPPHFLQMHTGEINQKQIDDFTKNIPYVKAQETVEMLNIDSSSIWYEKEKNHKTISMRENMMDNGFVKQNKKFDYLVDQQNKIILQKDGEISVPISYKSQYDLQIGDKVILSQGDFYREYKITSFARDSQMASTMASSTRFLLSDHDYQEVKEQIGELEYIIEYRFNQSSHASKFQKLYESDKTHMPKNGQAITYPLIRLVNSLSSGLMAGMLMFISLVLILIAALNLRFTILASLEEDIQEIGAMKAIGLSSKAIKAQYVKRYRIFAIIGCSIGYLLGMLCSKIFTSSVSTMFGDSRIDLKQVCLPILTVLLVYALIIFFIKKILRIINKITVVQALVYGETTSKKRKIKKDRLHIRTSYKKNINLFMSIKELIQEKKSWVMITVVFIIATNIMLLPMNLINTFKDDRLADTMGVTICDVTADIHAKDDLVNKKNEIEDALHNDKRVKDYGVYAYCKYETTADGEKEPFLMECGDFSEYGFRCMKGREPKEKGEIAISYLNHKKLSKNIGDEIIVNQNGNEFSYIVCGIYQDITSGGYTAKAYGSYSNEDVLSYTVYINLTNKEDIKDFTKQYGDTYNFAKVLPMKVYTAQTLGSVIESFSQVVSATAVIAVLVAILISALFLTLRSAKQFKMCATLRAIGFSLGDLKKQYLYKMGMAAGLGIVLGVIGVNTLGEIIVSLVLKIMKLGIAKFSFVINPYMNFLVCPIILITVTLLVTYACANQIKNHKIMKMIQE